jgi:heat shock protein HslJ
VTIDGDHLMLASGSTVMELVDRDRVETTVAPPGTVDALAAVDAVFGGWALEAVVIDGVRTSATPIGASPPPTLTFASDADRFTGVVRGFDGCNTIAGEAIPMGSTITFRAMSRSEGACQGGPPASVAETMVAVLAGEASYVVVGDTLTITKDDRRLELRKVGDDVVVIDTVLDQGFRTDYSVAADDRTVTFTLACAYTARERFHHTEVDDGATGVMVRAIVELPSEEDLRIPCIEGLSSVFTLVLDEPLDGRTISQPSKPAPPPPGE